MSNKEGDLNVLLGLLDFHSDRATAHASFIVASIFGLYAILFSFNDYFANDIWGLLVFGITYILLACFSFYSFLNFSKYASIAHAIQKIMKKYLKDEQIKSKIYKIEHFKQEEETGLFTRFRTWLLESKFWDSQKILVLIVAWFIVVFLPFVWILIKYVIMG